MIHNFGRLDELNMDVLRCERCVDGCIGYAVSYVHLVDVDHSILNFQLAMVIKMPHVPLVTWARGAETKLIIR